MEIYEKVKKYLYENIGHLTTAGTPRYDVKKNAWKVPVLCKTERGIIVIGEFALDKDGNFLNIPTKQEVLKTCSFQGLAKAGNLFIFCISFAVDEWVK